MEKLKFVLVGCGRIATLHVAGYKDNEHGVLWGVYDTNMDRAREFAAEHGVPVVYDSFEAVLSDPDVVGVELLIPHHLHCEYTVRVCQAGKNVSVQKPMAMTLDECDKMIAAAKENGVKLKVYENFVFYPPYQFAKKLLDKGEIGDPVGIRLKMNDGGKGSRALPGQNAPEEELTGWEVPMDAWRWRFNTDLSGGGPLVFDDGYHKFSMILHLLGDVEKVMAWIDYTEVIPGVAAVDSPSTIMWKHKDKKLYGVWDIVTSPDMYIKSKYYTCDEQIEITGTKGVIWMTRCTATMLPDVAPVIMYKDGKRTEYWDLKHDWADSFYNSTIDFIESVKYDREPALSGQRGRDVLKFALAAVNSSVQGTEVFLDKF